MNTVIQIPEILKFSSNFLFAYGFGRILLGIYKSNSYLYQAKSFESMIDNWIDFFYPIAKKINANKYKKIITPLLTRSS